MSIEFYIKNNPTFDGKPRVQEHYKYFVKGDLKRGIHDTHVEDLVDEAIKKQHPEDYAKFSALYAADYETYYKEALKGEAVYIKAEKPSSEAKAVEESSEPKKSKKKGK